MTATLPSEEQPLLTRTAAEALIRSLCRTVERVVRVCDDGAVLFISHSRRPWTAWLTPCDDELYVQFEREWPASFNTCSAVTAPVRRPNPQLPEHTD